MVWPRQEDKFPISRVPECLEKMVELLGWERDRLKVLGGCLGD